MSEFSNFNRSQLYGLLTVDTKVYTRMLSFNTPPSDHFLFAKGILEQIQAEIQAQLEKTEVESSDSIDGMEGPTVTRGAAFPF